MNLASAIVLLLAIVYRAFSQDCAVGTRVLISRSIELNDIHMVCTNTVVTNNITISYHASDTIEILLHKFSGYPILLNGVKGSYFTSAISIATLFVRNSGPSSVVDYSIEIDLTTAEDSTLEPLLIQSKTKLYFDFNAKKVLIASVILAGLITCVSLIAVATKFLLKRFKYEEIL
jgi:hypothetical protein